MNAQDVPDAAGMQEMVDQEASVTEQLAVAEAQHLECRGHAEKLQKKLKWVLNQEKMVLQKKAKLEQELVEIQSQRKQAETAHRDAVSAVPETSARKEQLCAELKEIQGQIGDAKADMDFAMMQMTAAAGELCEAQGVDESDENLSLSQSLRGDQLTHYLKMDQLMTQRCEAEEAINELQKQYAQKETELRELGNQVRSKSVNRAM